MEKGVSVIICTHNGATRIGETLVHLSNQQFTIPVSWEVIVVNNASADNTIEIIQEQGKKLTQQKISWRIFDEPKPGKIYALERAVSAARFEYFIICDDDNRLHADYVEIVYRLLESDPEIGAVGGQSEAVTDAPSFPDWFDQVAADYAVGSRGQVATDVTDSGYLWGAGLGSRTPLYKNLYKHLPSLQTGRKGNLLTAGEDGEYCLRLVIKGYHLYYDPRLRFTHFIDARRLTMEYREKLLDGIQTSARILDLYYLALHLRDKTSGKPFTRGRLILMTPFRWLFARTKKRARYEKNKLFLLLPFHFKNQEDLNKIKEFVLYD